VAEREGEGVEGEEQVGVVLGGGPPGAGAGEQVVLDLALAGEQRLGALRRPVAGVDVRRVERDEQRGVRALLDEPQRRVIGLGSGGAGEVVLHGLR